MHLFGNQWDKSGTMKDVIAFRYANVYVTREQEEYNGIYDA